MNPAPIALFVYNRPRHTRQTIESLAKNGLAGESDLYVFSDGAKSDAAAAKVAEVRELVGAITGFRSVTVVERERNLGLARSIIAGVTDVVARHGRIIVLEDDMVTSPFFLRYMNEALELYRDEERVISIHGYVYPVQGKLPETFFLRGADCWGWATWKRGWDLFEPDGARLLAELKERNLEKQFDFNGAYAYTRMLKKQIDGKNDSWAIRWHASAFLRDKLTLYPGRSLINNIGLDTSGTHSYLATVDFEAALAGSPVSLEAIPVAENEQAVREFELYFRSVTSFRSIMRQNNGQVNMKKYLMNIARDLLPPIAVRTLLPLLGRLSGAVVFKGNYATWADAQRASSGYDADLILTRVRDALLKVKNGEAVYERDSVLFDKIQYSWPLLAGLLWVASQSGNRLNLIDFGGSLGSTYYQNRKFLEHLAEFRWSIIEQEKFVACGKRHFEDERLKFYDTLDACIADRHPNAILLSSVLPYVEKPYELLTDVMNRKFTYLLVTRTPFLDKEDDRLTVQTVPPEIYPASYPAWFFNLDKFLAFLAETYDLIEEFDSFESFTVDGIATQSKGFIFRRRDTQA